MDSSVLQPDVATPDPRASAAGRKVLDAGGSATDAMIAATATLCVIYPHMVTLGGDAWILTSQDSEDRVRAYDGTGRAPAGLSIDFLREAGYEQMPNDGIHSISTPGIVSSWWDLHQAHGLLPWADLFADAITYARGCDVAPSLVKDLNASIDRLAKDPGCAQVFMPGGKLLGAGGVLRQSALERSLGAIAEQGADALYRGDVGAAYLRGLRDLGSQMTHEDLAAVDTGEREPLCTSWQGVDVYTTPANSQGFTLMKILATLSAASVSDPRSGDGLIKAVGAAALACAERDVMWGERADVVTILGEEAVQQSAGALATAVSGGQIPRHRQRLNGDTAAIVALDSNGLWASSVQSVAGTFGSGVLEPTTGILGHNRAGGFTFIPGAPSQLVGGARPPHTLMPGMVRQGTTTKAAVATMGGRNQPAVLAQVIFGLVQGQHPQQAVANPRWAVIDAEEPTLLHEQGLPDGPVQELVATYPAELVGDLDNRMGHAQVIARFGESTAAGSDPRADDARELP